MPKLNVLIEDERKNRLHFEVEHDYTQIIHLHVITNDGYTDEEVEVIKESLEKIKGLE